MTDTAKHMPRVPVVYESFASRPSAGHFGFAANIRTADGWHLLKPEDWGFRAERNGLFCSEADARAAIAKAKGD